MAELTVVARIKSKPGAIDRVRAELVKLLKPTRREAGCILYDMHEDNQDPTLFIFYETWQSEALLEQHLASPHLNAYRAATDGLLEEFEVRRLTRVV